MQAPDVQEVNSAIHALDKSLTPVDNPNDFVKFYSLDSDLSGG